MILDGADYGASTLEAAKVKATTFKLYAKSYLIYGVKISHWYINGNNQTGGVNLYQAAYYCKSISTGDSVYHVLIDQIFTNLIVMKRKY